MTDSPTIQNALRFAAKGWKLFPAQWVNKTHKGCIKWKKGASSDADTIREWGRRWPDAYYCVSLLEGSGLTVVDVDIKNDKRGDLALQDLESAHSKLPETLTATTPSGGLHYFFEGDSPHTYSLLGHGIDTPVMVPLPGTVIPGKGAYKLKVKGLPKPLPEWLTRKLGEKRKPAVENRDKPACELDLPHNIDRAIDYLENRAPESVKGDGGDRVTYQVIAQVRDFGVSEDQALDLMLSHWNEDKAFPGWSVEKMAIKVRNVYRYARDRAGNAAPDLMFDPIKYGSGFLRCAADIRESELRARDWILGRRYLPKHLTITVAPGGVGKSLLTITEALSVVSGKDLLGMRVYKKGAVWLYNLEDHWEELEKRVCAAAKYHKIDPEDLKNIHYTSGIEFPMVLAYHEGGKAVANEKAIQLCIKTIKEKGVKLFIIDPLVSCHHLDENSNPDMDFLAQILIRIAVETDCAVGVVHHSGKGNKEGVRGDMDQSRGASSLMGKARIAHTLFTMSVKEAVEYGVDPEHHRWYIRLDDAKANLSPPAEGFTWFRKQSVGLSGCGEETTGTLSLAKLTKFVVEEPVEAFQRAVALKTAPNEICTITSIIDDLRDSGVSEFGNEAEMRALMAAAFDSVVQLDLGYYARGRNKNRAGGVEDMINLRGRTGE